MRGATRRDAPQQRPSPTADAGAAPRGRVRWRRADPDDPLRVTEETRSLGLVVLRGTAVMVVLPTDGTEEIANPFLGQE